MPFEQKGQTMTLTTDDPRHPCNTVTIPRAQHESLIAENEKLKGIVAQIQPPADIGDNCTAELAVKCASLEAENERLRKGIAESCDEQRYEHLQGCERASKAEERIRELRRKTIEECVATKVTLRFFGTSTDDYLEGFNDGALAKTDSIRALVHSESEGKEESKE